MKPLYIVAVSGGVDSVVLLHKLVKATSAEHLLQGEERFSGLIPENQAEGEGSQRLPARESSDENLFSVEKFRGGGTSQAPPRIVIAHVDHGIRQESGEDAQFVARLAREYGLQFESTELRLGSDASEEQARAGRWKFLRSVKDKYNADKIITAHHADDVVETMIINLMRGTGWRGIASVRETEEIARPLLGMRKSEIIEYANEYGLRWHEDATNQDDKYLRNRVRHVIMPRCSNQQFIDFMELHHRQLKLREKIEKEVNEIPMTYRRYEYVMWPDVVAREMLRRLVGTLTRRELDRALLFVRTARHQKQLALSNGLILKMEVKQFIVLRGED